MARSRSPELLPLEVSAAQVADAVFGLPSGGRWLLAVPGLVLLFGGERLGRLGLPCAAFVAGVAVGQWGFTHPPAPYTIPSQVEVHVGVLLISGVVGMWLDLLHPRVGLVLVGGVVAATCGSLLAPPLTPWLALAGALVLPWVYETSLRATSALVGAVALTWALAGALPGPWIVGMWAAGLLWQLFAGPAAHEAKPARKA
jgi:hypothetical protein